MELPKIVLNNGYILNNELLKTILKHRKDTSADLHKKIKRKVRNRVVSTNIEGDRRNVTENNDETRKVLENRAHLPFVEESKLDHTKLYSNCEPEKKQVSKYLSKFPWLSDSSLMKAGT